MKSELDENGIYVYVLPKGTELFKGDSSQKGESFVYSDKQKKFSYFGFDKEQVQTEYGITFKFETTRELRLIAMDMNRHSPFSMRVIGAVNAPMDQFEKNYGYSFGGLRFSEKLADNMVSKFIIDAFPEYDGYASEEMLSDFGGIFHEEAMIKLPMDKLSPGVLVTNKNLLEQLKKKQKYDSINTRRNSSRARSRIDRSRSRSSGRSSSGRSSSRGRSNSKSPNMSSKSGEALQFATP
jgi:hypothetical protein